MSDDAADGYTWIEFSDETTFSSNLGQSMFWNGTGTGIDIGLPDVFLSLVQTSDTTYEIHMENLDAVSGFQFGVVDNPDFYTLVDVVGTDRVPGDWAISGNDNAGVMSMLGFSFNGTLIEPGSGPIVEVTVAAADMDFMSDVCFDEYFITTPSANEYLSYAECSMFTNPFVPSTPEIALTAEGGFGEVELSWSMNDMRNRDVVDLEFGNVDFVSGTAEVFMTNSEAVGGFQFEVTGVNATGGSGGSAGAAGFAVSAGGATVLGFSFTGSSIPAGSGLLTTLTIEPGGEEICFGNITMSSTAGTPLPSTGGDCYPGGGDTGGGDTGGGDTGGGNDSVVMLEFGSVDFVSGSAEVYMTNSEAVGGFQFEVTGVNATEGSGRCWRSRFCRICWWCYSAWIFIYRFIDSCRFRVINNTNH